MQASSSIQWPVILLVLATAATEGVASDVCDGIAPIFNTDLQRVNIVTDLAGNPVAITAPPGDTERIFIVESEGRILIKKPGTGPTEVQVFLDISDKVATSIMEMGLLGLAFDPDYANNGYFYVHYTEQTDAIYKVIARYSVSESDPDLADSSETRLLTIAKPYEPHNGGDLQFGPDGFLYIANGDGGGQRDAHGECGNGQDTSNLLAAILRIDPHSGPGLAPDCGDAAANYTIPMDNPLVGTSGCNEIWAYGLRNPWRFSFDSLTGDMYIGDVGQECWEEINYAAALTAGGKNYGWRQMEGMHCFDLADATTCEPSAATCGESPDCNSPELTLPVVEHGHGPDCSAIGGFVYRGCRMPNFQGVYFYGDWCSGEVRSFEIDAGAATNQTDWSPQLRIGFGLNTFGLDARGEIYYAHSIGRVEKIVPPFSDTEVSAPGAADPFRLHRGGNWTWEDLAYTAWRPVEYYRVYRGTPNGDFVCIHSTLDPTWPEGDTLDPGPDQMLTYLVTAVQAFTESSSGTPPRNLTVACGAP